jgi:5'-deoxynucleotidase YfbR-like HD superfamily hydrolase
MKTTVSQSDFLNAFQNIRPENFSHAGLSALFNYLEEYETETGQEIELDVIAICCEYSEYENLAAFQEAYSEDYETIADIEQETTVIRFGIESFIIQSF